MGIRLGLSPPKEAARAAQGEPRRGGWDAEAICGQHWQQLLIHVTVDRKSRAGMGCGGSKPEEEAAPQVKAEEVKVESNAAPARRQSKTARRVAVRYVSNATANPP